ncbi:MAG: SUMF1/EgtB/PvdO family nonheme iron enzyme [Phycisphaerales bacterium]|nr:SUMF1/EgtB/PvdO family nonheme iron enzyme [Phycisphaerales bacterium]
MKTCLAVCAAATLCLAGFVHAGQGPRFELALSTVPGGGAGPAYSFKIGQFEVSNVEFAEFLNDAEANPGNERGANMLYDASGDVGLTSGYFKDALYDLSDNCDSRNGGACPIITYNRAAPPGSRYAVAGGYENHPATGVGWIGAVKFCNWLTLDQGLGVEQICYTEGPREEDWHPVVIDTVSWLGRDLNDEERARLVSDVHGFRLPMDNLGYGNGPISRQQNLYNEWYKAAAYDTAAPDTERRGPGNEYVSPDHWIYAIGRDAVVNEDSNFRNSRDAYEPWITPMGYYNGENLMGDGFTRSHDTNNPWRLYDLSGNVGEWLQDHCLLVNYRAVRGGTFDDGSGGMSAAIRSTEQTRTSAPDIGFRVLRIEGCAPEVRRLSAVVDGQQLDKVDIKIKLVNNGSPAVGWSILCQTTQVENGRIRQHPMPPTDPRGLAKNSIRLPSGTYVLEIIDIQDSNGFPCMPPACRHCLAVFTIP